MRRTSVTKRNVVSNILGKACGALLSILFLPVYLRLLGTEAYGLVGLFASMQMLMSLFDMGLSPMLTRELARLSAAPGQEQEGRDLVRTLEGVYWLIGLGVGLLVFATAPWIAAHALHSQTLSSSTIVQAIRIMGALLVFQWPDSFYTSGILGLQRQAPLNVLRTGVLVVQIVGGILILKHISCTIQAYFLWFTAVYAVQTLSLVVFLWRVLPKSAARPRFRRELWHKNAHFMAGMTGIVLTSLLLTQLDKVVVMSCLPLAAFGYYTLAGNLSNSLTLLVIPIYTAVFPRYSQLLAGKDEVGVSRLYHQSCQLLSLFLFPLTVLGVLFSREILTLYLRSPEQVANVDTLFRLFVLATSINSLQLLPHGLQLAYGWTRLPLYKNLLGLLFYIPLMYVVTKCFGPTGVVSLWLALNTVYVLLEMPVMHRRILRGEMAQWYIRDIGVPLCISLVVGLLTRQALPASTPWPLLALGLFCSFALAVGLTALTFPWLRFNLLRFTRAA